MGLPISTDLASHIQTLSAIENNDKLSPEEKKSQLQVESAKTLAEIDAEITSLNFTSKKYSEQISKIISDGDWNQLPTPEKLTADLQTLRQIASAVKDAANSMSTDMTSILRLLAEANRTLANINAEANIQNRKLKLKAADDEFAAKEKANKEQLVADLLSASAEIVAGGIQLVGAGISLHGARKNIGKSKELLEKTHELSDISTAKNITKQDLADVSNEIERIKPASIKKIQELDAETGQIGFEKQMENVQIKSSIENKLGKLDIRQKQAVKKFDDLSVIENTHSKTIDTGNEKLKASNQKYEGFHQILNSSATIFKGAIQGTSSIFGFYASSDRLEAEKLGFVKDLATQSEQLGQESYRNAMEGYRNTTQSLSAMEQSINSSMSHIQKA